MENGKAEGEGDLESMGVAEDEILHGVGGGVVKADLTDKATSERRT